MADIETVCAKLEAIGEAEMYEAPASTKAAIDEAAALIRQQATEIEKLKSRIETLTKPIITSWHDGQCLKSYY